MNEYYDAPPDLAPGTKARSVDINQMNQRIDAAFDKLPDELALKGGFVNYAVNTGTNGAAYKVQLESAITAYQDGLEVKMRPVKDNTGACTLNVNNLGNIAVKRADGTDPAAGDIIGATPITLTYQASGNVFRLPPVVQSQIIQAASSNAQAQASAAAAAASAATALKTLAVESDNPPANPIDGQEWIDATSGRRYTWDANSSCWAETYAALSIDNPALVDQLRADLAARVVDLESYFIAAESTAEAMFQRAIDAVSVAGGGQVMCSAKTYLFNGTITLPSKVELVGRGEAATRLRQTNLTAPLIKSYQFDALTGTSNAGGIRRSAIRGMTLEGTITNGIPDGTNAQHGVQVYGYGLMFEAVHIRNFGGLGLSTEWATPGTTPDSGWDDGFVENRYRHVKIYQCGLSGMKVAGSHDGQWVCVVAYGNNLKDASADKPNVWITTKGNPQYIDQLHAWGNTSNVAMLVEGSVKLSNCALEGASQTQLRIKTGEVIVKGGEIFAAGSSASKGIEFVGGPLVCIGFEIDTTIRGCNGGSIDFGTGVDAAMIRARLFQTAGTLLIGTTPTAGPGNSLEITSGGTGFPRSTYVTRYHATFTNFSLVDSAYAGIDYSVHGGEGVFAAPQRKTEPAANFVPASGWVFVARVNAAKFWQSSGHVGAIMGEPAAAVAPADNLDFSNYQTVTLAAAGAPVVINNFVNGLNGSPIFLLMPSGGSEITLSTTGNIRSKTGANITRTGLGSNRLISFVRARDGFYYQA